YGTTNQYALSSALNSALVTSHSVVLSSLAAGTAYHFRAKSKNSSGALSVTGDFTFTTASSGGSSYTLTASPANVAANGNLSVTWTVPSASATTDWIGLFPAGTPNTAYGWWKYTGG